MSDWTNVKDIRKKLEREWAQGKLLVARLTGAEIYPKRIILKKPKANQWAEKWDEAIVWVNELIEAEKKGVFTIEMQEVNLRKHGKNEVPSAVIFETDVSIFSFIGKQKAVRIFDTLCVVTLGEFPELQSWLEKRPVVAINHHQEWPRIMAVLNCLKSNPRPGVYVRQLEIPDVDTKFIENHKKLLSELLDCVLPEEMIDFSARGAKGFEQRYGFLSKPVQVRFRLLDTDQYIGGLSDLQVTVTEFSELSLDIEKVIITENDINGLAFPEVKRAIVVFGLGFGLDRLAQIDWLRDKNIYYWGDIDTHGFVMLDQIRSYFSGVSSFLMDMETLMAHRSLWGREGQPAQRELKHLSISEKEVYDCLRDNVLANSLRLEQERIVYSLVLDVVKKMN